MSKLTNITLRYDTITDMADEEKAKTLWYYGIDIFSRNIEEIPSSDTYNEYKAWNFALYQYYIRRHVSAGRILPNVLYECVAVADNIRAKITNLVLFEQEWRRWEAEHEDFISRIKIGNLDAYCATLTAFNAHLARTIKNDTETQEVTDD